MSSELNSVLCSRMDLKGARIEGNLEDFNAPICLPNENRNLSLVSLDIGGTLIKLVYLLSTRKSYMNVSGEDSQEGNLRNQAFQGGILKFVKFEIKDLGDCLEFIRNKQFHNGSSTCCSDGTYQYAKIMATGGGSHKYEDLFKDRLGFTFHRVDELEGLVGGANFLLKNVHQEAFTYTAGRKEFIRADPVDLFPYLLVTIGSGVTWIKVTGEGKAEFFTGSTIGGSTMLGMARVLTKCKSYDHFLELSQQGDDSALNLTVGDIYGEMGNIKYNIPPSSVACRFGKLNRDGDISLHKVEDVAASLLSGFIYHIIHTSHLVAKNLGIKRIVFGGSFTIGHSSTMGKISNELYKRSRGEMQAIFLRHEGFLGALGAFLNYGIADSDHKQATEVQGLGDRNT